MYSRKKLFPSWLVASISSALFLSSIALSSVQAAVGITGSWVKGFSHAKESGTSRALVVMLYGEGTSNISASSVTYGGQTMTLVTQRAFGSGTYSYTGAFVLNETGVAAASSGAISVTWATAPSTGSDAISIFLTGVNQSTLIGASATNGVYGTTIATTALATLAGDMVLAAGTAANNGSYTINNGFTRGIAETSASFGDITSAFKAATGANETPSLTSSASQRQTIVGFVVKGGAPNIPPTVSITSPASGATFNAPASITINANASDADGSVTRVQFYNGTTLLGEDVSSPYSLVWSRVASGNFSLTAVATDNLGATTTSVAIPITVLDPFDLYITNDGHGYTDPSGSVSVFANEPTPISAFPDAGYQFANWTVTSGTADILDPSSSSTTVTLSSGDATIQALFTLPEPAPSSRQLAISGTLADANGEPVGSTQAVLKDVSVRLYTEIDGQSPVYTEEFLVSNNRAVSVEDGLFVVRLGTGTTADNLASVLLSYPNLFAEITIEDNPADVLTPRTPISAAPYALSATPSLVGATKILHGSGSPVVNGVNAQIGNYYIDDKSDATWLKVNSGWKQID